MSLPSLRNVSRYVSVGVSQSNTIEQIKRTPTGVLFLYLYQYLLREPDTKFDTYINNMIYYICIYKNKKRNTPMFT
nr:MAG TPA: hypothetical protein [Caudoviricetes sp.]